MQPMRIIRHFARGGASAFLVDPGASPDRPWQDAQAILTKAMGIACESPWVDVTDVWDWLDSGAEGDLWERSGAIAPWPESYLEALWQHEEGCHANLGVLVQQSWECEETLRLAGCVWYWSEHRDSPAFLGTVTISVTEDGSVDRGPDGHYRIECGSFLGYPEEFTNGALYRSADLMLATFQLANAKNIEFRELLPTRQQRRLAQRRNEPVYTHYVLTINANVARSKGSPTSDRQGIPEKRLHLCRGHFAVYTEDAPLFGKHTGAFWIRAHARGSLERGVVTKDYRLKVAS